MTNYKKGDKIKIYNIFTKRNKTVIIDNIRDNGTIESNSGRIIYPQDIIKQ